MKRSSFITRLSGQELEEEQDYSSWIRTNLLTCKTPCSTSIALIIGTGESLVLNLDKQLLGVQQRVQSAEDRIVQRAVHSIPVYVTGPTSARIVEDLAQDMSAWRHAKIEAIRDDRLKYI